MNYNKTISDFIEKRKININKLRDINVYTKKDINKIISDYGLYQNGVVLTVKVEDIIGKSRGKTQNILLELNDLFNEKGNSYQKRSISMLEYDERNIIKKLKESFYKEPIVLNEIVKGKYIVGNNGMHRCNLLRCYYENELLKTEDERDIEQIKEEYTIKAIVENLDIIKTYTKLIFRLINKSIIIEQELNKKKKKTGKTVLIDENEIKYVLNDEELLNYLRKRINLIPKKEFDSIYSKLYLKDEYFKDYINKDLKVLFWK